jgi:phosphoglycerol transferase MdoB-like AlkP superfamily enzyme
MKSLFATISRERVLLAFGTALLAVCFIYRVELAAAICFGSARPFNVQPEELSVWASLKSFGGDLLVVVLLTLVYLALKAWLRWRAPRLAATKTVFVFEVMVAGLALFVFALIVRAHYELIFELESGLTATVAVAALTMFTLKDFSHTFTTQDVVFLVTPFAVFGLALAGGRWLLRIYKPVFLFLAIVVLLAQFTSSGKNPAPELSVNPLEYFVGDALQAPLNRYFGKYFGKPNPYRNSFGLLPGAAQMRSIRLIDEAFVTSAENSPRPKRQPMRTPDGKPWNVLMFVLESTGSDYVFDTSSGGEVPMPFLQRMAGEGLQLTNHYTTCNSTPSAGFSIFTGLYPPPSHKVFSLQKDAAIPTVNRYLGSGYDYFLVQPPSLTYYFPTHLLLNNGFKELDSQETIPQTRENPTALACNEIDAVDFLLQRLDRAREPFFGIYWSFVPHYPYSDYGPEYRIRPDSQNKRDLYYNNLRTLDVQLRRVYEHLVQSGLAERTILIFVGDHGEAFGQHPGVWAHTFGGYSETYRTPMIFWQPKLIAPQVVSRPTSHVDILPTLLDLMGVPWNESKLQGESVLRESTRKYIFAMDAQADYVSIIDREMNKISLSVGIGTTMAFNDAKDPAEKLPLNEDGFPAQIDALLKFGNYQTQLISNYNAAVLSGRKFPPEADAQAGKPD